MNAKTKKVLGPVYDFVVQIYFFIICNFNLIRFFLVGNKNLNYKEIPIVINNRNRLTFLRQLINSLEKKGYHNIIILDNDSTYPPLLEYYKSCSAEVIFLNRNLGFDALDKIPLYKIIRKNYFVYTDPDILPVDECPDDFLKYFLDILQKYPQVQKVGFSLKIDDLPDYFKSKAQVIKWEQKFYNKRFDNNLFIAPIDTTFALHRPYATISTKGRLKMFRTGFPYLAYHLPWYNDSDNESDEEKYYVDHVEIGTHWSKGLEVNDRSFLRNLFR